MHFVVSWDLRAEGNRWTELNAAMVAGLRGHAWIRLLSTFYILEIDFAQDWQRIHGQLLSIAHRYPGEVNFLMSPIYEADSNFFVFHMPDSDFYRP